MAMLFSTLLLQCALSSASSFSVLTPLSYSPDTTTLVNFASDPIVKTTNGSISGKFLPTYEQDAFLGIPFAAPPVGPLRFRAPQPLNTSWTDVRPAKTYGPGCAQWSSNTNVKEDCLTLNVVRPTNTGPNDKLPVFVAIYGGGFRVGASSEPAYNLSGLVALSQLMKSPMIGVSINYRLDVWGFLATRSLMQNGDTNAGLLDQVAGFRWIQDNISAFGGDKNRVTLWGMSAGAQSIGLHLHSFGGKNMNLYSGAIMESGGPVGTALPPLKHYIQRFEDLKQQHGCGSVIGDTASIECLRRVPEQQFFEKKGVALWNPIVDGNYLTQYPSSLTSLSAFVKVPVITGANSDEGLNFGNPRCASDADIAKWLSKWRGHNLTSTSINKLIQLYNNENYEYPPYDLQDRNRRITNFAAKGRKAGAIGGDLVMLAQVRKVAQAWTKARVKAWTFRFDTRPWNMLAAHEGVKHGVEVTFSFQNITGNMGPYNQFKHHRTLGEKLGAAYINFVARADPNPVGRKHTNSEGVATLPHWPSHDQESVNMVLNATETKLENDDFRIEGIKFINGISRELMA